MSFDIVLENLVTNNVRYAETNSENIVFNIFESGLHKSDGELIELLYDEFTPLNFTSVDNGLMVSDLCLMANAAYLDHNHGDVLYLYMLAKRNGMLDDMGLVNTSAFAMAITNFDNESDGQLRVLLVETTSNSKLAEFYKSAHYQDDWGVGVYSFAKTYSKEYEKGFFGFNVTGICKVKDANGTSVSTNDLKGFLKCMIDSFF